MASEDSNQAQAFQQRSDQLLQDLLARFDAFDPDELEADLAGGVLRLTFADGRKCVMNRQAPAQQIWLAEGATAWHFAWDPATSSWRDTKGRGELHAILAETIGRKLGRAVQL